MYPMPTLERLAQSRNTCFQLWIAPERALDVELLQVAEGQPMTPEHQTFSAFFALPEGSLLPQAVYRLSAHGEEGWPVLMTPAAPEADGRPVLQAVFHWKKPLDQPATTKSAGEAR
ncbi:hypothetical protein DNK06_13465 [Pseudomonas daroniae]|uniref:DUF6916 domain-containing protein n=2 Tax=Phytopseudomonas TaxID=3236657 RepID=A0A4Q9QV92_9GAMM|nr:MULTISPECIES: hypothetical protein [Pseudomonas]TBU72810.1 hypothetical protein DNK10_19170 [Pseudomonas daroniae]TBU79408.1 hypothetical protein DNK06_13465 [Pseudomonas daroniae]TBU79492.1 hypothetical protein DNK31_19680 [Pseudomonas sp. FRB 228]TBU87360.1 hypothetical protein DNK44_20710 [Pseudomonas dryadis]TBU91508.1 hypothetical protein DNJ99_10985 [Pseudomonas daroniae]